jgi:hypothetical protein
MTEYVTIPLDIEGVKVNHVEVTGNGEVHIHVSSTVEGSPTATGAAVIATAVMRGAGNQTPSLRLHTGSNVG